MIQQLRTLQFIVRHPLNSRRGLSALRRWVKWQIGSRLVPGPVAIRFVNDAKLLVRPGMTGATGNVYTGLHEFQDMAFVLHALRGEDLFVDVGANVGSYTVLAGAAVGASCISFEPIPATYNHLQNNIFLNNLTERVRAHNIGIGSEEGELKFTSGLDTVNHVLGKDEEAVNSISVPIKTLDSMLAGQPPSIIKIDVEGFEADVIKGATATMQSPSLMAVVMELRGHGNRYGFDEAGLHQQILSWGYQTFHYEPFKRRLVSLEGKSSESGNTLYVKDIDKVRQRLENASKYSIAGRIML